MSLFETGITRARHRRGGRVVPQDKAGAMGRVPNGMRLFSLSRRC